MCYTVINVRAIQCVGCGQDFMQTGLISVNNIKIFLRRALFVIIFVLCFAVMFVMLCMAVMGLAFGVVMSIFGIAVLAFEADFIISGIAPTVMLFGGLTAVFFSLFTGLLAVKIGFAVSHFYIRTRNFCERLRELSEQTQYNYIENDSDNSSGDVQYETISDKNEEL